MSIGRRELTLALMLTTLGASAGAALTCGFAVSDESRIESAARIFRGTIVGEEANGYSRVVLVRTLELWKGPFRPYEVAIAPMDWGPSIGSEVLFAFDAKDRDLALGACGGGRVDLSIRNQKGLDARYRSPPGDLTSFQVVPVAAPPEGVSRDSCCTLCPETGPAEGPLVFSGRATTPHDYRARWEILRRLALRYPGDAPEVRRRSLRALWRSRLRRNLSGGGAAELDRVALDLEPHLPFLWR